MPRLFAFLLIVALSAPAAHAYTWGGTWSTTHGELRIVSIGSLVVGDYADRGTLVGQVSGSRLTGVFTNGARAGRFDWTHDRDGAFSGSWNWVGETASGAWSGNQTTTAEPPVTNFSRDGRALRSIANSRDVYDGTYGGTFGEVRLRSSDLVLVGDYGDNGAIAGMWDGNSFVGTFTNGPRVGWFDWAFLSRTGTFRSGQWGWIGEEASGEWTLSKTSSASPRLTSLRPASGAPAPTAAPEAAPYTRLQGAYLRRGLTFDLDKARTLVSMQEHVKWVSGDEATARRELTTNGFTLHGNGFIDTEAGGLAGLVTTGRLRAYVAHRGTDMVVVFRGSGGSNLWQTGGNALITDFNIRKRRMDFIRNAPLLVRRDDPRRNARVHVGFADAYDRLRPDIMAAVEANPDKNVYVFGHSLGGALSMLCAIDLATDRSRGIRSVTHISSGTPRVGNGDFRSLFESAVPNNLRMTVGLDPVPLIPVGVPARLSRFSGRHYRHAGRLLPLSRDGVALRANEIKVRLEGSDFGHHDNGVYLDVARAYLERVTGSGQFPNVDALGDAERAGAEDNVEAVLAAIPSLFD